MPKPKTGRIADTHPLAGLLTQEALWRQLMGAHIFWLTDQAARSAQPFPRDLKRLARRHGLQSVVTFRNPKRETPLMALERTTCAELGIGYHQLKLATGRPPKKHQLHQLVTLMAELPHPALFHCKAGVDRTGLVASLYLHLIAGWPMSQIHQMKFWPYLFVRNSPGGIMARLLDAYAAHPRAADFDFLGWVDNVYDPKALKAAFKPSGPAVLITRWVLRRG